MNQVFDLGSWNPDNIDDIPDIPVKAEDIPVIQPHKTWHDFDLLNMSDVYMIPEQTMIEFQTQAMEDDEDIDDEVWVLAQEEMEIDSTQIIKTGA